MGCLRCKSANIQSMEPVGSAVRDTYCWVRAVRTVVRFAPTRTHQVCHLAFHMTREPALFGTELKQNALATAATAADERSAAGRRLGCHPPRKQPDDAAGLSRWGGLAWAGRAGAGWSGWARLLGPLSSSGRKQHWGLPITHCNSCRLLAERGDGGDPSIPCHRTAPLRCASNRPPSTRPSTRPSIHTILLPSSQGQAHPTTEAMA